MFEAIGAAIAAERAPDEWSQFVMDLQRRFESSGLPRLPWHRDDEAIPVYEA